jgi:hypothetical protein
MASFISLAIGFRSSRFTKFLDRHLQNKRAFSFHTLTHHHMSHHSEIFAYEAEDDSAVEQQPLSLDYEVFPDDLRSFDIQGMCKSTLKERNAKRIQKYIVFALIKSALALPSASIPAMSHSPQCLVR